MLPTIKWDKDRVILIDQRRLPEEEVYVECTEYNQVADAIEKMVIRGAPAIGVAASFGVALGLMKVQGTENLDKEFDRILSRFERTRPTARNLFWALERMKATFTENRSLILPQLKQRLIKEALAIEEEDIETNKKIGFWGRELIRDGQTILTHCNAGALATAGYGTALGVVRAAFHEGKKIKVYVDETRPFLQGARLTCWELDKDNIPVILITDNMAGYFMQRGMISMVITGADRIARNGDTANKIGTYMVSVLAKEHNLPFYVAAPLNTIDFDLLDGSKILIEERNPQEVRKIGGQYITLPHVEVRNPAFDVTPAKYISAIVTEKGIALPPFEKSLAELKTQ
ncbi:MAG: S-methyl-5-thioribose-1-phosphate isomerase [Candidatus Aminicenantes bacterium]|nr:MAG: S-methyl-5-thioribose-1-phosphate isomerase [Candidatus Aminicenantes bacterium]